MSASSSSGEKQPVVVKPKSDTVDDLEKLKEKLKEIESTSGTETYTVQGNPGLSVGGTVLEQLLDISIAFFKQPLVNEALKKIIKDESDAKVITDTVKEIGSEIVKVLNEKQVLACAKKFECEQEGTSGDGMITCDGQEVGNTWHDARMHIADKNLYSSEKTGQCDRYIPDLKNIESIYETLKTKLKSMMTDVTRQKLLYDTVVNIGKNNIDFFAMHDPSTHHFTKRQGNPFEQGGEFLEQMPYEKFRETATNFSNQF